MSASAVGAIVNSAAYCEGRRVADVEIKDIGRVLSDPDRFIWIGLHEPDEDLLRDVQREFGLHDLAIEDAHSAHQRPKLERYGDALFVVLRTAQRDREQYRIVFGETHIFVGSQYLVSVRHGPSLTYADVRARCETTPKLLRKGPGFDVYDHVIRINETVDTSRELLSTALEANLALRSVAQNESMKRLAGWAAIIAVPTAIAGIYGMNFKFMPELEKPWAYPAVLVAIITACTSLYFWFRRIGWL